MDWGHLIKRSWQVTWRYKALWVLGIFAGISGCQPGGGGNGGGGGNRFSGQSGGQPGFDTSGLGSIDQILVWLFVALGVLLLIGLIWAVFGIAARGGLVTAVNEIEEGRERRLGELWGSGFSRWWSILGIELFYKLPLFLVGIMLAAGIIVPIIFSSARGDGEPGPEVLLPICGSLVIAVPLLIVLSLLLQVLYLLALRFLMLQGMRVMEATSAAWRVFRTRFKDVVVMYLINAGLNLGAGFVLAIPAAIIGIGLALPLIAAVERGDWRMMAGPIVAAVLAIIAISIAYNAIWGTYTSALWTLFFRRLLTPVAAPAYATPSGPYPQPGYPPVPPAATYPQPPAPLVGPQPPAEQPPAPPVAPQPPAEPPVSDA